MLENLLLFLAYWLAMYFGIVATEHLVFRKNSFDNYAPGDYTNWRMLPLGVAGFFALGLGWTGAALGKLFFLLLSNFFLSLRVHAAQRDG